MRMREEERISNKMLRTKMEGRLPRRIHRTRWMDKIESIYYERANWEEMQENRKWENGDD